MKKLLLIKTMLLLCALVAGSGTMWGQTYQQLTSIANIDESAQYVLGIDGTGFHYSGTSNWGLTALPAAQTPIYYTLKKAQDGNSFTAETTISGTKYYLQIPTSNVFGMATSTGTNTDIIIGTSSVSGTNYAVANKTTTTRHLRINGASGLRSYANTTGTMAFFYKVIPAFTLTATSNNESYGTVSVSGNVITGSPKTGYRYASPAYTVTSGTATVSQSGNTFTVTASAACTVQINFEAIPTNTVIFNAEGGSCATTSLTEASGAAGVTLPTATISGVAGWEFVGWAESKVTNTSTMPTLYKAGLTYYPSSDVTLHAVYTLSETGATYTRVTSASQIAFAKKIAIVSNRSTSKILTHDASGVNAPSEDNGEIIVETNQMFAISGDNTNGYVLTGSNGTLSQATLSTSSSSELAIDWSGTNNLWIIEDNTNTTNVFTVRNAGSDKASLEYDGGWKTYYVSTYLSSTYTAMRLYIPKTAYNSNPSAIKTPTVEFDSKTPVTLYLDGTKTNTNVATVSGVSKTINYTSSNTSVATVNSDGVVTAVGIGTATITASVDAELGVSASASDTYIVTVKSTTTIGGIKNLTSTSTEKAFSADLTDAVVTFVKGDHAYIQDGSAAIYVNFSNHGLVAGKKINGAVSGKVKAPNQIDQITELNLDDAIVTDDGVAPAVVVKTLAEIKSAGTTYDGKLVTVNAATLTNSLESNQTTNSVTIKDGSQIEETDVQFTIYAPNKGITLKNREKGNFTGFVSIYVSGNTTTYRLNLYEQDQFTKTHNVPEDQVMSFTDSSYNLDEETAAVTSFAGQAVTETTVKGSVTYRIKDGSDEIITSLNPNTGAVVLNGNRGTATIVATAAYAEVDEGDGYLTPYKELSKEYSVTVRPRYTVTFNVNGDETELREASFGVGVTVPANPDAVGLFAFQGWSSTTVATTNTKPSLASLTANTIYTPSSDETFYAVFAREDVVPNVEQTSKFTFKGSSVSSPYVNNEATWTFTAVTFNSSNNAGLSTQSITVTPSGNVSSISSVTVKKTGNSWARATYLTLTDANNNTLATIHGGDNNSDFTNSQYLHNLASNQSSSYTFTSSGSAYIESITLTYRAPQVTCVGYTTSLSEIVTIGESGYASYCSENPLDFSSTSVKAYTAKVDGGKVKLTEITDGIVPANEGVVLAGAEGSCVVPTATEDATTDFSDNEMVGVTVETSVVWSPVAGVYNYILQQGTFKKALSEGGTLRANRAYLSTSYDVSASGARELQIVFDNDINAVQSIDNDNRMIDNVIYNLNGMRVAQPVKGQLYIINGKKTMVK